MSVERMLEIERMEAECGCELPELSDPTLAQRAQRLLDCEDPPKGKDLEFCQTLVEEGRLPVRLEEELT